MTTGMAIWAGLAMVLSGQITPAADVKERFEARVYEEGEFKLPYRLLKPLGYDPQQKYPLVIFLHGAGERGDDNEKQLIHGMGEFASDAIREKYPAFVLAPQCPTGQVWGGLSRLAKNPTPPDQLSPALGATLHVVEQLQKEFSIDAKRIYLTGLSMGGFGTWDALAKRPELFAAAVPICGGGRTETAARFKDIPIWAFHGAEDRTVPPERSREMIDALKAAGGQPKYTEYEGVGHNSWVRAYRDPELYAWLFAQRKP